MAIEPDTEIVHTDFGSQARLKPCQIMRPLTRQAKGMQELVVDRFDDLPNAGQPAPQCFGPANTLRALVRWRHQIDLPLRLPALARAFARKTFVRHIGARCRQTGTGQARRWLLAQGNKVVARC